MRKIRYAVVGLGNIAQVAVLPAFQHAKENSELVALLSGDAQKRKELSRRYGVKASGTYDDLEKILEEQQVDAAYIGVPNSHHRAFAERIAHAGAHVLCEKPLALTEVDCRAVIGSAKSHEVKLMVAYRLHFDEANLRTVELIQSRKLGEVRAFSSVFSHQVRAGDIRTQKRFGGGGLFDLGVYCINAARYLFAAEPIAVTGLQVIGHDERFTEVDELTSALMHFPDDRVAQFTVCQGAASVSNYQVLGTRGDVRLEGAYEYATAMKQFVTIDDETTTRTFRRHDQFAPELVYFSRCILEDEEPEPSGEEGLIDVRIMNAIIESARTKRLVALPPMRRTRRPRFSQAITKPPVHEPKTVHAPSPSLS